MTDLAKRIRPHIHALSARPDPAARRLARQARLLGGYLLFGIAATFPRITYLWQAKLPDTWDQASYVWDLWWTAHQVEHLASPFTTTLIYAPAGTGLGYHDLMPLIGLLMLPVTALAGPGFAVNLLAVTVPGLLGYCMYRAARLWLAPFGAFATGVFFGLSSILTWRAWFHLNIAVGALFLPIVLEIAVRLRRKPTVRTAVLLGAVFGCALLTDLESAILAGLLAAAVLLPWALRRPGRRTLSLLGTVAAVGVAVGSPEILAMLTQHSAAAQDPRALAGGYVSFGVALPQILTPSPRVADFGLRALAQPFHDGIATEGMPTFGVTLTVLALLGAIAGRRLPHRKAWLAGWLGAGLLALGPVLYLGAKPVVPLPITVGGQRLSLLMPYTWFVHLPGLANFREANRFIELALVPAALLAGSAVLWLRARLRPVLALVLVGAVLELGWGEVGSTGTIATGLPGVDRAIAADHSNSIVVDLPLGFRSGALGYGARFDAQALAEATLDDHPRAIGWVARLSPATLKVLVSQPFYADLIRLGGNQSLAATDIPAATSSARALDVGWVIAWQPPDQQTARLLADTGFTLDHTADGVSVYRAAHP